MGKHTFNGSSISTLLIFILFIFVGLTYISTHQNPVSNYFFSPALPELASINHVYESSQVPTNLNHLVFGLVGSEKAYRVRKAYTESWWRPNVTRGFLFLDKPPTMPWPKSSPPYRVSEDLREFLNKTDVTPHRIMNGIMETFNEDHENMRWLVMGDDDSIFFLDNMVEVLRGFDHTKFVYIGGHSENILSNFRHSFSQGFGGAGFILSYPLAEALAGDMRNCLLRYKHLDAADQNTMYCIGDLGVSLTSHKGIHQIDMRGDLSGFLSSHPDSPLISLHHFDMGLPIFPAKNRYQSANHLLKAANIDSSRMLQQTICHYRPSNWSISISWGYSAHIYEKIMPRSYLKMPLETFTPWLRKNKRGPPYYMFNTRKFFKDPCEAPHSFFFDKINRIKENEVLSVFKRGWPRHLPACYNSTNGKHSADPISRIEVYTLARKRFGMDKSECCDVVRVDGDKAEVTFRECMMKEIIA